MPALSRVLVTAGASLAVTGAALAHSPATPHIGAVPTEVAPAPVATIPQTPHDEPTASGTAIPRGPVEETARVPGLPLQVSIPSISLSVGIVPVSARPDGALAVPPSHQAGWWIGGAEPGANRGTTVLASHVDTADGRPGAFYHLSTLRLDAAVQVRTTAGVARYKVVALRTYRKEDLPRATFDRTGPHRLILITCGGPYESGYSLNVVVYAVQSTT